MEGPRIFNGYGYFHRHRLPNQNVTDRASFSSTMRRHRDVRNTEGVVEELFGHHQMAPREY